LSSGEVRPSAGRLLVVEKWSVPSLNSAFLGCFRLFAPYLLHIARRSVKKCSVSSGG
jgi:hypothetical protein